MKIVDNINTLLGDDLKATLKNGTRLKIAASCFSIYAFEALKAELSKIDKLDFVFTAPTFIPEGATDQVKREQREFFIVPDRGFVKPTALAGRARGTGVIMMNYGWCVNVAPIRFGAAGTTRCGS